MEAFYRRWLGPTAKAEALADAAREVREQHPHR